MAQANLSVCFDVSFQYARPETKFGCLLWVPSFFIIFPFYPPYYTGSLRFVRELGFDVLFLQFGYLRACVAQGSWSFRFSFYFASSVFQATPEFLSWPDRRLPVHQSLCPPSSQGLLAGISPATPSYYPGFVGWHLVSHTLILSRVRWSAPRRPRPHTISGSLAGISSATSSYYLGFVGWHLVSHTLILSRGRWLAPRQPRHYTI